VMTRKIDRSCRDHVDQNREEFIAHVQDVLIPKFQELGFLNDELYTQALFNSLKQRGYSKAKIKSRLIQKSVPSELIAECLNEGFDDAQAAEIFARKKKIGKYQLKPYADYNEKQKDLRKLARAGFSYDIAMRVIEG